jgi:wyosine [tRNA(Phe)-imidazoG37] synthetase (radical SAM superfamily)
MNYKYLFGPVPSRRMGRSLGVDITPHKTCSLNCVYCECGRTTKLTLKRKEYVSAKEVIKELRDYLSTKPILDFVTFSGAGEPTLNSGIGEIIKFLKTEFPKYKTAVLTNSTLFNDRQARKDVLKADVIVPSLDAVSQELYEKINEPYGKLKAKELIAGLIQLRKEFKGEIWLEIFLVPGMNDTRTELDKFKDAISKIKPDKVQLNTLHRPGTKAWVKPLSSKKMDEISKYLGEYSKAIYGRKVLKEKIKRCGKHC